MSRRRVKAVKDTQLSEKHMRRANAAGLMVDKTASLTGASVIGITAITGQGASYLGYVETPEELDAFMAGWERRGTYDMKGTYGLLNAGKHSSRLSREPEEYTFALAWERLNPPEEVSTERGVLAYLLSESQQAVPPVSRNDRTVAATVIQWLGSSVGGGFLRDLGYVKKGVNE